MKSSWLRYIDRILGSLLYIIAFFFLPLIIKKRQNKKVLIIKLWAIGESVLLLPSIKELSKKGYKISVLCTTQNKDVFIGHDFIEKIIIFYFTNPFKVVNTIRKIRSEGFSVCIDAEPFTRFSAFLCAFSGSNTRIGFDNRRLLYNKKVKIKEQKHIVEIFHELLSSLSFFPVPKNLLPIHSQYCNFRIEKNSVAIHAGSASSSKIRRWSEIKFSKVCMYFIKKGWTIYLVGSGLEEEKINAKIRKLCKNSKKIIDLSNKLKLPQLAFLFSKVKIVIANDSGPMHIAASMNVPVIGLFGPNAPERFGPYGKNCIGLRAEKSPPCILPFRALFPECKHEHMKNISPEEVIKAAKILLSNH